MLGSMCWSLRALLGLLLPLLLLACPAPPAPNAAPTVAPAKDAAAGLRTRVSAKVRSYGKVVYEGPVDLTATIARIRAGQEHPHRNDGSVFKNRERRLPKKPRGYYREYVHPTRGRAGPGPQRIVRGRGGEWYYTPDHYETFVPLHE